MSEKEYLKKARIKITNGRLNILKIFTKNSSPINAEQIYLSLREDDVKIDLSTVYRTLELFEENNIITKIISEDHRMSYILREKGHKHIIECSLCHKEVEYDCPMPQIKEILKKETGFYVTCGDLNLEGVCDCCKEKNK
ncbi:Fur family transcriptional regulator [Hathewaya histolytica]|uniref:Fur family transcriptional regulator n=1 Tax=Hathewaya histolytica TaxID=1498 RepID=UPI003B683505